MLALWGMGTYIQRVPYTGKLELEGIKRGSKPSKRRSEDCPEQLKREERGEGVQSKKARVSRAEEKKFKKLVMKQASRIITIRILCSG